MTTVRFPGRALLYASRNIVHHRDIKPDHILSLVQGDATTVKLVYRLWLRQVDGSSCMAPEIWGYGKMRRPVYRLSVIIPAAGGLHAI
jgi:hypothetical protein